MIVPSVVRHDITTDTEYCTSGFTFDFIQRCLAVYKLTEAITRAEQIKELVIFIEDNDQDINRYHLELLIAQMTVDQRWFIDFLFNQARI